MILYITIAAVTALLASLVDSHPAGKPHTITRQQLCNRVCLTAIFLILFLLSACRLNVGNDYAKYVEFMHLVNCDAYVPTEIGFNLLVKLIYGLSGFENFLLVIIATGLTSSKIFLILSIGVFTSRFINGFDEYIMPRSAITVLISFGRKTAIGVLIISPVSVNRCVPSFCAFSFNSMKDIS